MCQSRYQDEEGYQNHGQGMAHHQSRDPLPWLTHKYGHGSTHIPAHPNTHEPPSEHTHTHTSTHRHTQTKQHTKQHTKTPNRSNIEHMRPMSVSICVLSFTPHWPHAHQARMTVKLLMHQHVPLNHHREQPKSNLHGQNHVPV